MPLNDGQHDDISWTAIAGVFGSEDYDYARMDSSTHALTTIDVPHHEIHDGSHYFVAGYDELGSAGTATFHVTTPDTTKWAHMTFVIESQLLSTVQIYEGATYAGGGSAVSPINSDRNSSNTSGLTIRRDGTASVNGTMIDSWKGGAAAVANKPGAVGNADRQNELILKQNTTYRYLVISGAASNTVSFSGRWYEHTNKG